MKKMLLIICFFFFILSMTGCKINFISSDSNNQTSGDITDNNGNTNNENNSNSENKTPVEETPRVSITGYDEVDVLLLNNFKVIFDKNQKNVGDSNVEYGKFSDSTRYIIMVSIHVQSAGFNFKQSLIDNIEKICSHKDFTTLNENCEMMVYYRRVLYDDAPNMCSDFSLKLYDVINRKTIKEVEAATQLEWASVQDLTLTDEEVNSIYDAYWKALGTTSPNA